MYKYKRVRLRLLFNTEFLIKMTHNFVLYQGSAARTVLSLVLYDLHCDLTKASL